MDKDILIDAIINVFNEVTLDVLEQPLTEYVVRDENDLEVERIEGFLMPGQEETLREELFKCLLKVIEESKKPVTKEFQIQKLIKDLLSRGYKCSTADNILTASNNKNTIEIDTVKKTAVKYINNITIILNDVDKKMLKRHGLRISEDYYTHGLEVRS
jgi:RecB family endonuclease NucS